MCQLVFEEKNGILLVKLQGEITLLQSNDFKEKIKKKLLELDINKLIIDLSNVPLVDSSGLGILIALFKFINQRQGKIIYTGINEYVNKVLNYAKLDQIFTIADNIETAREMLK